MANRTPAELIKWAWMNRKGELLKRDLRDILSYFNDACFMGQVWVFEDKDDITGLLLCTVHPIDKEVYVSYARALNTHTFKLAFKRLKDSFSGYTMLAHRYGTLVKYPL